MTARVSPWGRRSSCCGPARSHGSRCWAWTSWSTHGRRDRAMFPWRGSSHASRASVCSSIHRSPPRSMPRMRRWHDPPLHLGTSGSATAGSRTSRASPTTTRGGERRREARLDFRRDPPRGGLLGSTPCLRALRLLLCFARRRRAADQCAGLRVSRSDLAGHRRTALCLRDQWRIAVPRDRLLHTRDDRHQYVTGANTAGPIAFVGCSSERARNDAGPHHRWASGILWDRIDCDGDAINVRNRGNWGTGHGWAGANCVVWNSQAESYIIENPPTARAGWSARHRSRSAGRRAPTMRMARASFPRACGATSGRVC